MPETTQPVTFRVRSGADPAFAALLAMYIEAHPASERKPETQLRAMIERPGYRFEVLVLASTVVGFAIVCDLPGTDATLLEYMAIAQGWRGHGLGSLLFRYILPTPARFLLAEVESDHIPSPEGALQTRRKHFYRNLGCFEIDGLTYLMPPVSASMPPPMNLMIHHSGLPARISRDQLRVWLEAIYVEVYAIPLPDARIDEMLATLPEDISLL